MKDRNLHVNAIPFKVDHKFCLGACERPKDFAEGLFVGVVSRFVEKPDSVAQAIDCISCRYGFRRQRHSMMFDCGESFTLSKRIKREPARSYAIAGADDARSHI